MNTARLLTQKEIADHIASQLRAARLCRHLSQKQCGKVLGVSFQQFQKYETGQTTITAADLFMLASFLHQPLLSFFPTDTGKVDAVGVLSASADTVRAAEAFHAISDDDTRGSVLGLLRTLGSKEVIHG